MFEDIVNSKYKLTRDQEVILYVINTLNELVKMGILEGGGFELSEDAMMILKEIEEPSEKEIERVMESFKREGYIK